MKTSVKKRKVELVVISDVHLGTYGCHARELLVYLKSIQPKIVVLNGDIIDIWQFSKRYWPKSHMKVISHLLMWVSKRVRIYYITGNHDEMLRRFSGFKIGNLTISDKLVLPLSNDEKAWFFHGDVFDVTMQHSKWLAKLGAKGYDALIIMNRMVNFFLVRLAGREQISLSKRIKNGVKSAVSYIGNFEETAADIAIHNNYNYVVCGHIHQPVIKKMENSRGSTVYLNSGDWVENLTALEYHEGCWQLYTYQEAVRNSRDIIPEETDYDSERQFMEMLADFNLLKESM